MRGRRCVCGCGARAANRHHCIYYQEIKKWRTEWRERKAAGSDKRNLVPIAFDCHGAHHSGQRRLHLAMLPDSVFEFAVELMGASPAYCYLRRYYAGEDARLDALLESEAA